MTDHGHSQQEITDRIGAPPGRGVLRDAVYGAIDGAVTTFAIVAGVAGAGLSPLIIVILGLANVLADGFSMAAAAIPAPRRNRTISSASERSRKTTSHATPKANGAKFARSCRRKDCQTKSWTRPRTPSPRTRKTGSR